MSEHFEVGIGLHQGSALSPFLFIMLVDTLSQDVRTELPWELLYANDLAMIYITSTDTQNRLESWQKVLTDNGLKINAGKTEHLSTRKTHGQVQWLEKNLITLTISCTWDRWLKKMAPSTKTLTIAWRLHGQAGENWLLQRRWCFAGSSECRDENTCEMRTSDAYYTLHLSTRIICAVVVFVGSDMSRDETQTTSPAEWWSWQYQVPDDEDVPRRHGTNKSRTTWRARVLPRMWP